MSSKRNAKDFTNSARVQMAKANQILDLVDAVTDLAADPSVRNVQRLVKRVKRASHDT